jgi:hypothetical protein
MEDVFMKLLQLIPLEVHLGALKSAIDKYLEDPSEENLKSLDSALMNNTMLVADKINPGRLDEGMEEYEEFKKFKELTNEISQSFPDPSTEP